MLERSVKDRAENAMVVDMMRNDVGRVADRGSVQVVSAFQVEKFPTVYQMTITRRPTAGCTRRRWRPAATATT
jgi:anthranilate/para-aminobenzoate synthase component I